MADLSGIENILGRGDRPWLIVTDLDGTLLDHHDYSHKPADSALAGLESHGVPVIFNTSKTFAEVVRLRKALHNRHPFIVENGSAIYIPHGYFPEELDQAAEGADDYRCIVLGRPAADIQGWLHEARQYRPGQFLSLGEMSTEQVMDATGLDEDNARLAQRRGFSAAVQWRGSEEQQSQFRRDAAAAGFRTLRGGRFLHLLGSCDKGQATQRLASEYENRRSELHTVIAAGDGGNDVDMLEAADVAILVRSPAHEFPRLSSTGPLIHTEQYGPAGWAEVVQQLLDIAG